MHNFADDNTIAAAANSIVDLINVLETESDHAIKWFKDNDMIVNPEKFHAIIINKCGRHNELHDLKIDGEVITSEKSVKLLGIDIDYKINFNNHICNLCKKAAGQLNAICRSQRFIGNSENKVLIDSFAYSIFIFCPMVWMHTSQKSIRKIERIQERAFRLLLTDYTSTYNDLIVQMGKSTMSIKRHRTLCLEIFKNLNNLNPSYMKDIFVKNKRDCSRSPNNLMRFSYKGITYGKNSLRNMGPDVWNNLPEHFKECNVLSVFKRLIRTWDQFICNCKSCTTLGCENSM